MKKILYILFFLTSTLSIQSQDLRLATIENQGIMTVCSYLIREVYRHLDMDVEILPMTALRAQQESSEGSVDGEVARISAFGDLFPQMIMVPTALYQNTTSVFIRKDSGIKGISIDELNSYRIARIRGVVNTDRLTENVDMVYDFDNLEDMFEFVKIGRADIALTSSLGGLHSLKETNNKEIMALTEPIISRDLFHFLHWKNRNIIPLVDEELRKMKESGELEELIRKVENELLQNE